MTVHVSQETDVTQVLIHSYNINLQVIINTSTICTCVYSFLLIHFIDFSVAPGKNKAT